MHTFASVWLQAIDMSPLAQCSELRFFLLQILMNVSRQIPISTRGVLTASSACRGSTILTCDAAIKPDAAPALELLRSSILVSIMDTSSTSSDLSARSQKQSKRS